MCIGNKPKFTSTEPVYSMNERFCSELSFFNGQKKDTSHFENCFSYNIICNNSCVFSLYIVYTGQTIAIKANQVNTQIVHRNIG